MGHKNIRLLASFAKKNNGFTLIELIVVTGIISIIALGAIAVLKPEEQFMKANDAKKKADLAQIQRAIESYYEDNGAYPASSETFKIEVPQGAGTTVIDWGSGWQPYMNLVPKSPTGNYAYYSSGGQSYYLYASLERSSDNQLCNGGNACTSLASNGMDNNSCGSTCNYAVTSPNVNP